MRRINYSNYPNLCRLLERDFGYQPSNRAYFIAKKREEAIKKWREKKAAERAAAAKPPEPPKQ